MTTDKTSPMDLWNHPEFVAGHTAGAAWWTAMKPGVECPKPECPYETTNHRELWTRGFDWGAEDAENSYYQTGD